jgi:molybdopterin converting factor small subunit
VKELVQKITRHSPELRRNIISGELKNPMPNSLILVNGKEISVLDGLETALKDGDEVTFVPVVHGG